MRHILTVFLIFLAGGLQAQDHSRAEIPGVIRSQIDAFLSDDFETAFGFASPGIRSMFGSPERFGDMVRGGYPMVWRPGDYRFLGIEDRGAGPVQRVLVRGPDGALYVVEYTMLDTEAGWKIDAVEVLRSDQMG